MIKIDWFKIEKDMTDVSLRLKTIRTNNTNRQDTALCEVVRLMEDIRAILDDIKDSHDIRVSPYWKDFTDLRLDGWYNTLKTELVELDIKLKKLQNKGE